MAGQRLVKADYIAILQMRGEPGTWDKISDNKVDELKKKTGSLSAEEWVLVNSNPAKGKQREEWYKARARSIGDRDDRVQASFVELMTMFAIRFICLTGSPGTGKTWTLIKGLLASKAKKALFLTYNNSAAQSAKKRLRSSKRITVRTIDAYALNLVNTAWKDGDPKIDQQAYQKNLINATRLLSNNSVTVEWEMLVLDEAQDLDPIRSAFIEALAEKIPKLVIAGDDQQSVRAESASGEWFRHKRDTCPIEHSIRLTNNHRATPSMVDGVNKVKRALFEDEHALTPVRTDNSLGIRFVQISDRSEESKVVLEYIRDLNPQDVLIISLISTESFGMDKTISEIIEGLPPGRRPHVAGRGVDLSPDIDTYNVATPTKVKGLEFKHVVLLGTGFDYERYEHMPIPPRSLACNFFVAVSRASEDCLIIVQPPHTSDCRMTRDLSIAFSFDRPNVSSNLPSHHRGRVQSVMVSSSDSNKGLSGYNCIDVPPVSSRQVDYGRLTLGEPIDVIHALHLGILAETLVDFRLQPKPIARIEVVEDGQIEGSYIDDGVLYLHVKPSKFFAVKKIERDVSSDMFDQFLARLEVAKGHRCPVLAKELFDQVDQERIARELDEVIHDLRLNNVTSEVVINRLGVATLHATRSKRATSEVRYKPDIECSETKTLVELKYKAELTESDRRQIGIYACLHGYDGGFLYNLKSGECLWQDAVDRCQVERVARGDITLREATLCRRTGGFKPVSPPTGANHNCLVAFDQETHGEEEVIEESAIAVNSNTSEVLIVYDEIDACWVDKDANVVEDQNFYYECPDPTEFCFLKRRKTPICDGVRLSKTSFIEWIKQQDCCINPTILVWRGKEKNLLEGYKVVDVLEEIVKPWCTINAKIIPNYKLGTVFNYLFPHVGVEPHRAFDDALMTVAIYVALVKHSQDM